MDKDIATMSDVELKRLLSSLRERRRKLGISARTIGDYIGYSESVVSKMETGKTILRACTVKAYVQLMEEIDAGKVKLKGHRGISYPQTAIKEQAVSEATPEEPADEKPNAKPNVKPNVKPPEKSGEKAETYGGNLGLSVGLVRRTLRISPEEGSKILGVTERILLLKEAGLAGLSIGEAARLLGYYAQRAAEQSCGQKLLYFV